MIKGLLWYQGESDTSKQYDADAYRGNMTKLIENVREGLGLPSLPIIQVRELTSFNCFVRRQQVYGESEGGPIGNGNPKCLCVLIDAKGLELKDDHLHLTSKSQVQLGPMLADAYLQRFGPSEPDSHAAI
ncbi:hypothetical protein ACFX15_034139 [Malus domestica]|uniref:Sialate O-acetylesterase domain-containing protein n=1 Tax=Malus domestica TaxID=3750 RepID=A0A498K0S8_MALDO|nr:probable carbohydrate esterase At4g34215 [Malus domestica]RXH99903.1 hypothetical protein DVH24_021705 [Malus domestica]